MSREKEHRKPQAVKMDMTPMIDVVFQLIIFFILTMTVTSKNLKDVVLPTALTAVDEKAKEDNIHMLHLYNDLAKRQDTIPPSEGWHITAPDSTLKLTTVEQVASELKKKVDTITEFDDVGFKDLIVLVRGDLRAPSHFFAVIIGACQREDVRIRRLQVSIAPPPERLKEWK